MNDDFGPVPRTIPGGSRDYEVSGAFVEDNQNNYIVLSSCNRGNPGLAMDQLLWYNLKNLDNNQSRVVTLGGIRAGICDRVPIIGAQNYCALLGDPTCSMRLEVTVDSNNRYDETNENNNRKVFDLRLPDSEPGWISLPGYITGGMFVNIRNTGEKGGRPYTMRAKITNPNTNQSIWGGSSVVAPAPGQSAGVWFTAAQCNQIGIDCSWRPPSFSLEVETRMYGSPNNGVSEKSRANNKKTLTYTKPPDPTRVPATPKPTLPPSDCASNVQVICDDSTFRARLTWEGDWGGLTDIHFHNSPYGESDRRRWYRPTGARSWTMNQSFNKFSADRPFKLSVQENTGGIFKPNPPKCWTSAFTCVSGKRVDLVVDNVRPQSNPSSGMEVRFGNLGDVFTVTKQRFIVRNLANNQTYQTNSSFDVPYPGKTTSWITISKSICDAIGIDCSKKYTVRIEADSTNAVAETNNNNNSFDFTYTPPGWCDTNDDCSGSTSICNPDTNQCVQCLDDSACQQTEMCEASSNTCVSDDCWRQPDGDANCDEDVNEIDFQLMTRFIQGVLDSTLSDADPDFNADGATNLQDFWIWRVNAETN